MKRISSCPQLKNACIKIITILLILCLAIMLFGCGNNKNDYQTPSESSSSSAVDSSVVWNNSFKDLFHTDLETEIKFADLVHDVNQTEGAMTLLQTLNNGKVLYVAFEFDSMDRSIPDSFREIDFIYDCILIRGNQPAEEIVGLSGKDIKEKFKEQLFYYGSNSVHGSGMENGKSRRIFGFSFQLASDSVFTGDITIVVTDMGYYKEDDTFEHVTSDNYVFHITETPTRQAVEQPIIYDDQTVGKFRLTEMSLQLSIFQPEEAEELASALDLNPDGFAKARIKLLDNNLQEIDCRIGSSSGSSGGIVTGNFSFGRLVDTSEVSGIQVGDYVIMIDR